MSATAKVLIVDDSRIFRAALEDALRGEDGVAVVGSVFSGEKALDFIRSSAPDLVTLDVEMPGLGGLGTLAAIQQLNSTRPPGQEIGVLMVSAFTRRGADVTVKALQSGAFDFVTKPCGDDPARNAECLRNELSNKIRWFLTRRHRYGMLSALPCGAATVPRSVAAAPITPLAPPAPSHCAPCVRPVRAVLIAASTGGPRALSQLLPELASRVHQPIVVVQHMPAELTTSLAENLARVTRRCVIEAANGQELQGNSIYIAPGGKHLGVRLDASGRLVGVWNEQERECGCRPSANVLFRTAAAALPGQTVALILTGMGNDGTAGLAALKRAGGYVIAQDEATSVVWGMPGSAVEARLADAVLPLCEIPAAVATIVRTREPR